MQHLDDCKLAAAGIIVVLKLGKVDKGDKTVELNIFNYLIILNWYKVKRDIYQILCFNE